MQFRPTISTARSRLGDIVHWRTSGPAKAITLTARLAIAMIMLVAIAVSAVGWLSYRSLEQALVPRVLDRIETHSKLVVSDLQSHVRGARGDVAGFRSAAALNGLIRAHQAGGIDPVDGLSEATWRERIAARFLAELEAKPAYAQFRIIGIENGGREIVRADRSGPNRTIRLVPDSELQQKGDRPYFKDTISKTANEIYVSAIDLNQENGVLEKPYVPTLRIGTPLQGPDGRPFGIVIINVDMRPAFDRVRSSVRQGGNIYVVNDRGDYLVHPDRAREFASQLGPPARWQADFPSLAASPGTKLGIAHIAPDQTGQPGGLAMAPAILAGSEWVGVIETVPNAVIMATGGSHPEYLAARRPDRGVVRRRTGIDHCEVADGADHSTNGRGRRGRPQRSSHDSRRCERRNRRAGARLRARVGRSGSKNRRARTRGPGASPHRGGAGSSRGAGAPVQRRRRIVERRHRHEIAGWHHHRLESGRRAAVRISRRRRRSARASVSSFRAIG